MGFDLDLLAAILCGVVAFCLFSLHIVTSPRRHYWLTLPEYVRRGLLATGILFMLRSVNFTSLPPEGLGHINAEGMLVLVTLTYTGVALTVWVGGKVLRDHGWERLSHAAQTIHDDPAKVPVMMDVEEVKDVASLMGANVDALPPSLRQASKRGQVPRTLQ